MGGAFKRPPPAGGGKSRGPAGRGLNTILMESFTPYHPKHYVQRLIKILLDISKIYTPATSDKNPAFSARDFSRAVYLRVGQNS